MVLARWEWQLELSNRRVLLFVDNDSARGGVVKGRSNSPTMDDLTKAFYTRLMSICHPSGGLRGYPVKVTLVTNHLASKGEQLRSLWNARSLQGFKCETKIAEWLIKAASLRRLVDCRGKWKLIRASKTAKISNRSKPMDQMTYPQSRHPSLIPDVPPIEEKRVMRCRLLELRHRALDDHSMLLRVKFISRVQGRRDKKGIYTTWIALSWTKQLEHFLCFWQRNIPRNKLYQRK